MIDLAAPIRSSVPILLDTLSVWFEGTSTPSQLLTNACALIGNQFRCDACSIYLKEEGTGLLTLAGTVGLRDTCIGKIQMSEEEGLTGLVAQREQPVVVSDHAEDHPRFRYFPEAGEDLYQSFVGVPILNDDECLGVLVVQTFEPREFSSDNIRRLVQIGLGIGPLVAERASAAI